MNTLSRRAFMGVGSAPIIDALKFTVNEGSQAGTITLTIPSGLTEQECTNIQYSLNGRTWVTFENHGQGLTITTPTLNAGDSVYFRGQATLISKSSSKYSRFTTSSPTFKISASGSIMSLIGNSETITYYAFYALFDSCTSLTTAPILPVTTLADYCYQGMFQGCTSLTTAPELPAITLATYCYQNMFQGCTSLTTAPELPAITLATYCYQNMFRSCTSLTTAPELPAITLATYCYQNMFKSCTNLTTAPTLPATTLVESCYKSMFYGCAKVSKITMLATNISTTECLNRWVSGVAATGTFIKDPAMTTLPTGDNGIPNGWTVIDKMPISDAVDLGLSSGLKWSSLNLGATQPENVGLYFSWGNTEGHAEDSGYDFSQSNYNSTPAASISTDLSPNEDAANVLLGNGWRMPTFNEVLQLVSETAHEWTEINGKVGMKFMKKTDHSVFIFIPAGGQFNGTTLSMGGIRGYNRTSSFYSNSRANSNMFTSSGLTPQDLPRYLGQNIRPVLPAQ